MWRRDEECPLCVDGEDLVGGGVWCLLGRGGVWIELGWGRDGSEVWAVVFSIRRVTRPAV
jgi:hypothetical protein